ncbi:hypothetical protein BDF20DRAFT_882049 [Mycotypha africana]|uniref:uncharacterized protein n=1 Tax=Mycotypha africana TaxID=64632 RepID=UPI002300F4D9|nr:uncharacterized protein BDF20DRAFT_882049 [Mycotypha africana]KAI8973371.1 hypothetical protein BDF20DRAFT_882049 [Mycotypha africana]
MPQTDDDEAEMLAFGYGCKIFSDKGKASQVDNGDYLILWKSVDVNRHRTMKRPLCWMDRYDARHLMENWSDLPQAQDKNIKIKGGEAAVLDPIFDKDRYKDLHYHELYDPDFVKDDESREQRACIPYNHNNDNVDDIGKELTDLQKEIIDRYSTPLNMSIPENQEQITLIEEVVQEIKHTAKHAADINMIEIKFQVRNSNNPLYSFLNKYDTLYPFYRHLLTLKRDTCKNKAIAAQVPLVDYGSSSENDSETEESDSVRKGNKPISSPENKSLKEVIDKTASFIAKSRQGQQLLQHLKSKNRNNPKFDFLKEGSVHHAYFQQQLKNLMKPYLYDEQQQPRQN